MVVTVGETVIDIVVAPESQVYEVADVDAVNTAELPTQINVLDAKAVTLGLALTVTVLTKPTKSEQPDALVPVMV